MLKSLPDYVDVGNILRLELTVQWILLGTHYAKEKKMNSSWVSLCSGYYTSIKGV